MLNQTPKGKEGEIEEQQVKGVECQISETIKEDRKAVSFNGNYFLLISCVRYDAVSMPNKKLHISLLHSLNITYLRTGNIYVFPYAELHCLVGHPVIF